VPEDASLQPEDKGKAGLPTWANWVRGKGKKKKLDRQQKIARFDNEGGIET